MMKICEKCFKDYEAINIIKSLNQISDCDLCNSKSVYTYNEENSELKDYFEELLDLYEVNPSSTQKLSEHFVLDWDLLNLIDNQKILELVKLICPEKFEMSKEVFLDCVSFKHISNDEFYANYSILGTKNWEIFVEDLKSSNRFFVSCFNRDNFYKFCRNLVKVYKAGTIFYRARICNEKILDGLNIKFEPEDMGVPPFNKSRAGRANSKGIKCLYLADGFVTALNEVRAITHDYVTVGDFMLKEDVLIVDFNLIKKISPFNDTEMSFTAINRNIVLSINKSLATTVRDEDDLLDYLPTQYISDMVKSLSIDEFHGFTKVDGIEYNSNMSNEGNNLAIFSYDKFECINTKLIKIKPLELKYDDI